MTYTIRGVLGEWQLEHLKMVVRQIVNNNFDWIQDKHQSWDSGL